MSCEEPVDHSNIVFINYSSTDFGSNVTYYCKVDPSVVWTSRCIDSGEWWPDLSNITCNKRGIVCMTLFLVLTCVQ